MCYFVNHCPTPTAHSFALYLMPSALRGSSQVHSSQYLSITSPSLSGPEVSNPIMKVEASGTWLSRTSSIENEPRTLSFQEIECARVRTRDSRLVIFSLVGLGHIRGREECGDRQRMALVAGGSSLCDENEKCRRRHEHLYQGIILKFM